MTSASRVAEIFEQASVAFGRLAQLTLNLKQFQSQQNESESKSSSKWSQKEIDQLKLAVSKFGSDLAKIAETLESKTVNQIKHKLKCRTFQEAGLNEPCVDDDSADSKTKPHLSNPNTALSTDKGRRKQTLDQITEESEAPLKVPRLMDQSETSDTVVKESVVNHVDSEPPRSISSDVPHHNLSVVKRFHTVSSAKLEPVKITTPVPDKVTEECSKYEDYESDGSDYLKDEDDGGQDYDDDDDEEDEH